MLRQLINRSPALQRLRDEGFEISVHQGRHLLVHHIPYVTANRTVDRGTLVLELTVAGDIAVKPATHIAHWIGEHPCDANGVLIEKIKHGGGTPIGGGVDTNFSFSNKPIKYFADGYPDDYERVRNYHDLIAGPARSIDPLVTAKTGIVHSDSDDDSVFLYGDTASSRAGTAALNERFMGQRVAIVGLGGTGSYVLDFVAKTPVKEIHLFDGDRLLSHNAFRAPGAASIEDLRKMPYKVLYYAGIYGRQRRGIISHSEHVTAETVNALDGMDYVFLCIDKPEAKRPIIAFLEKQQIVFFDCGMGLVLNSGGVSGQVRTTTSTPENRDQVRRHIGMTGAGDADVYRSNIQIADLNARNALDAVIKWKKLSGFYPDLGREHNVSYAVDTNTTKNEDCTA